MIQNAASQRQINAADPDNSTWLSANAGSGKTRVLTDRVARLLLNNVAPQNILCLTYTKAAASEMQNRLFKRLGAWAMMADAELRADLAEMGYDRKVGAEGLRHARKLFAMAIETPGGLKIQTIHAFCAGVLRRFPLEAHVSPQFREMEDRQAELLRAEVVDELLEGTNAPAVIGLLTYFTGIDLGRLTSEILGKRDLFIDPLDDAGIREILGLTPSASLRSLTDDILTPATMSLINATIAACQTGSANDLKVASNLLKYKGENEADLVLLESVLLTGDGAKLPFSAKTGAIPTKPVQITHPGIIDDLNDLMTAVEAARDTRLGLFALRKTNALNAFGKVFVPAYELHKSTMGLLDFDDLIRKTKALLNDRLLAQWVLFRLDGGIDHVLVDEAQDTSPDQWDVIKLLTQEFTAGVGAQSDRKRTIFVVGDKKQSIYSFQGADPDAFDVMKHHFEDGLEQIGETLVDSSLDHSFRSSTAILRLVDSTFVGDRSQGLDTRITHIAFKADMPGRVDLWPAIEAAQPDSAEIDWTNPVDHQSKSHPNTQMAQRVAKQIRRMIDEEWLPEEIGNSGTFKRRKITEGDFLILVQRRKGLFFDIISACKSEGLNIAGADRLRVGAQLAVKDIAALLCFLALPEDDLSLAATLRSPLFGWTEKQLFDLAHPRPQKGYLWEALRKSQIHPETMKIFRDLNKEADFLRPYDLIERILTRHHGRSRLLARLGAEIEDGVDALLSQALAYESTGVPSLTGFLAWMEADDLQIKRQIDNQSDQIRVMTVHGSKGLEAPIVILPEAAKRTPQNMAELLIAETGAIWKTPVPQSARAVRALHDANIDKQLKERMRLLYVAMTRAEKWLIVGAAGDLGKKGDSWFEIVADGMKHAGDTVEKAGDLIINRVSHGDWNGLPETTSSKISQPKIITPTFDMLPVVNFTKTLSPSDLGGGKVLPGDPQGEDQDTVKARGQLIHLLLEHLPNIAPENRSGVSAKLISATTDAMDDSGIIPAALRVLAEPSLKFLFESPALVEVTVTAALPTLNGARMHGMIDRLIIGETTVQVVDYKTNRLVPDRPENVPEGLLRQMGAYLEALEQIYPEKTVSTAILWTETASLMSMPTELIRAALRRVKLP